MQTSSALGLLAAIVAVAVLWISQHATSKAGTDPNDPLGREDPHQIQQDANTALSRAWATCMNTLTQTGTSFKDASVRCGPEP